VDYYGYEREAINVCCDFQFHCLVSPQSKINKNNKIKITIMCLIITHGVVPLNLHSSHTVNSEECQQIVRLAHTGRDMQMSFAICTIDNIACEWHR